MCEPITIAAVAGGALMLAGGAMQAKANYDAGLAEEERLRENQKIAERLRVDALVRGEQEAGRYRMAGTARAHSTRAKASASGFAVDSDSVVGAMADERLVSEYEAELARNNAAREAWGFEQRRQDFGRAETAARKRRQSALVGDILSLGGQAASAAVSGYGTGKQQGVWK